MGFKIFIQKQLSVSIFSIFSADWSESEENAVKKTQIKDQAILII